MVVGKDVSISVVLPNENLSLIGKAETIKVTTEDDLLSLGGHWEKFREARSGGNYYPSHWANWGERLAIH
ncbi:MAG: hypothetical protein ABGU93_06695 [Acetobacterium sp.]|jgi:hypothetical protein|uniref:hypothetical protein n=1 Tax=Acetobacterium sp. TaxID=1872094 RepID=UPI0032426C2C